jgi:hypothetical protein
MIAELIEKIKAAVLTDPDLIAWCAATYGQSPTIVIGVDEDNPPALEDYPIIAFVGTETGRSTGDRDFTMSMYFGLGINDPGKDTATGTEYMGTTRIETFRELFENAVFGCRIPGKTTVQGESGDSPHPLYVGYVTITINAPKSYMAAMGAKHA